MCQNIFDSIHVCFNKLCSFLPMKCVRNCADELHRTSSYFELKNSWAAGAPLNLKYLLATSQCMFNSSNSWGCSIADDLKDTSRCHRLLSLQEFQVPRPASHPVKAPLLNCQTALLMLFDLHNTLNEDVDVTL